MSLTSLSVMQANKRSDPKAFLRIVPLGEDPAVLPHEDAFRAVQAPEGFLVFKDAFRAVVLGIIALVVFLTGEDITRTFTDSSTPASQKFFALLPLLTALAVALVLAVMFFMRKPSDPGSRQEFVDAYRAARADRRPIAVQPVKVWEHSYEGSLLIYVVLLELPSGQLLVRHTTGAAQPFEAPTQDATFYVWELPDGWKVVQVAKRTA